MLDEYFELQEKIYDYFGYVEKSHVYPFDDRREVYWSCDGKTVYYSRQKENQEQYVNQKYNYNGIPDNDAYSNFLLYEGKKWVSGDGRYTIFIVFTSLGGNEFLQIFDNEKQISAERKEVKENKSMSFKDQIEERARQLKETAMEKEEVTKQLKEEFLSDCKSLRQFLLFA